MVAEEASLCPAEVTFHVFSCGRWKGVFMERHALAASSGATIALECSLTADEAATSTRWFLVSHPLVWLPVDKNHNFHILRLILQS